MDNSIDQRFLTQSEAKVMQIQGTMPRVMHLRVELRKSGLEASAVVLPSHMDPGPYGGPDSTDASAQLMGLPIIWGDCVGLVVQA